MKKLVLFAIFFVGIATNLHTAATAVDSAALKDKITKLEELLKLEQDLIKRGVISKPNDVKAAKKNLVIWQQQLNEAEQAYVEAVAPTLK